MIATSIEMSVSANEGSVLDWLEDGMFITPSQSKLDDLPVGWLWKLTWMQACGDQIEVITVTTPSGRLFMY